MAHSFDLSGKAAIVTGTSRGLGQYFGRALARAGADLVITSRDAAGLADFRLEIEQLGRRAVPLDILVNNAGCNVRKPALNVTWDDWNLMLDTNLRGTFFVVQAAAREMIPRRYGRIINIEKESLS